jgi:hydroxyacylglutathione hydrolase
MLVQQIVHQVFTSNNFILSSEKENEIWLVDIGNFYGVIENIPNNSNVKGVFITHYHYDHIYGINELIEKYPNCKVYAAAHTIEGLYSDKMNLSFYHESPIIFKGNSTVEIKENDKIPLFENIQLEVFETPGHNTGCLTFKVNNYLFTGDSYIPNIDVVTKLKGGNKEANVLSLLKINSLISPQTIICPGHFEMSKPKDFI